VPNSVGLSFKLTGNMENEDKEIIGYGDNECNENCPERSNHPTVCMLMVLNTREQLAAARRGDMSSAIAYEKQQNEFAMQLGCEPGISRM